jgi:hypothetical protein
MNNTETPRFVVQSKYYADVAREYYWVLEISKGVQ